MVKKEVIAIMMAIKAAFPNFYKNQAEIDDAINLWAEMLVEDDPVLIAKAAREFIKTDASGFAPTIGQIRTKAAEIRKKEWEHQQRILQSLPEPETEVAPMPDELRIKLNAFLKGLN